MKRLLTLFVLISLWGVSFSQIQYSSSFDEVDLPTAIKQVRDSERCVTHYITPPDINTFIEENDTLSGKDKPIKYGVNIELSLGMSDGKWTKVDDGRVWSLTIGSKGARAIDIILSDIRLSKDAYIEVVNADGTNVYGPITADNCPNNKRVHAAFLEGDKATIYLFEPYYSNESSIKITNIVYGFKNLRELPKPQFPSRCNVNLACYPDYLDISQGVVMILGPEPGLAGSGALVMNTANDYKPYVLTAFHNYDINDDGVLSSSEIAGCDSCSYWFNYRYTECTGSMNTTNNSIYYGATLRSSWNSTDFALVELSNLSIKTNPNIRWLGWDRSGNVPTSGACLHHPVGTYMKVSVITTPFTTSDYKGSGITNHWKVDFADGIIQSGSSGGPLLDQNQRIVGQIHGGHTSGNTCNWTEGWCGKLSASWNGGGSSSTRLKDWLDPINSNATSMNSGKPLPYYIEGNTIPCGFEIYRVVNLLSGDQVTWSWQNSSSIIIDQNSPTTNMCCVHNTNHTFINNKLLATITNGGQTIAVVSKDINTGANFSGTYEQEGNTINIGGTDYYVPTRTPRPFISGGSFMLYRGSQITLKSDYFLGANISSSSSRPVPYTHSGDEIGIYLPYNGDEHGYYTTAYFSGSCPSSCDNFTFSIDLYSPSHLPPVLNSFAITPVQEGYNITPEVRLSDGGVRELTAIDNINWNITVVNQSTGQIVMESNVTKKSEVIKTKGWKSGIYVISVSMCDKTISRKITIQ